LDVLPVNPGFKYINDLRPNAFATDQSIVNNTQGTVYVGLNLINSEFERGDLGGIAVAGICAHECAHIYQNRNGWIQRLRAPTAKLVELQADYLAGFYFGRERTRSRDSIENLAIMHLTYRTLGRKLRPSQGDGHVQNQTHRSDLQQRRSGSRSLRKAALA